MTFIIVNQDAITFMRMTSDLGTCRRHREMSAGLRVRNLSSCLIMALNCCQTLNKSLSVSQLQSSSNSNYSSPHNPYPLSRYHFSLWNLHYSTFCIYWFIAFFLLKLHMGKHCCLFCSIWHSQASQYLMNESLCLLNKRMNEERGYPIR